MVMFLFTMPIFRPAKTYEILVIHGKDLILPIFKGGYRLGYGVTFSFIFMVIVSFFMLRYLILDDDFQRIVSQKNIKMILGSIFIFFLTALISSYEHSPHIDLSIVWLMQYMSYAVVGFGIVYLFIKSKINLLYTTLLASFSFQMVVVSQQFIQQRSIGSAYEFSFYLSMLFTGLDDANTFFRVLGTLMYHNQLAFVLGIFFALFFVAGLFASKRFLQKIYFTSTFLSLIGIVLTQSRSVWIALPIVFTLVLFLVPRRFDLYKKLYQMGNRYLLYLVYVFLLLIIVPRFVNSFNSTEWGSGIAIRKEMIREGLGVLQFSPFIGYGVGTNEHILFSNYPLGVMSVFPAAIHMAYVQLLLEVGIIGFIALMFPFFYILRTIVNKKIYNQYSLSYLCGIVVVAVYYLFQPHVFILEAQYLGIVFGIGLISLIYEKNKKTT